MLEGVLTFGGKPVTFKPSGELFLEVWHVSDLGPRHWSDGKTRRIEELIPQVVTGLIRLALAKRAKGEQQEAERLEQQRRAEAHARLQQQIKDEQARVRELRRVAADWHRTRQLRAFISAARDAAAQNGQAVEPGTSFGEWLGWAEEQADRLDPFKERPPSIIDRKSVAVAEYSTHYPYRKLDPPFRFPKPIWKTKP